MNPPRTLRLTGVIAAIPFVLSSADRASGAGGPPDLQLTEYVADSTAFHVTSVIITGPTEAVLVDAQFLAADARALADRIEATGKRLKAIFITHPDHDHFSGAAEIVERFPGTPVYMTPAAIEHFDRVGRSDFEGDKGRRGDLLADSVVTPRPLPSTTLTVDEQVIEIIPDLQGDVLEALNSVVWIPSLRTLIAGDLVFNGVHAWLAASTPETRAAWREDLRGLADLGPVRVIAGHKPSVETTDAPEILGTMAAYLADFDEGLASSLDAAELAETMRAKYPWKVAGLLYYSARTAFANRR